MLTIFPFYTFSIVPTALLHVLFFALQPGPGFSSASADKIKLYKAIEIA